MSYLLPHLHSGWEVDQAIVSEEDRVVIMRFGHDWDEVCMQMDEVLNGVADKVKNFAVIYLVDITQVPDFNTMYELYDPCTIMFFYRNKVSLASPRLISSHLVFQGRFLCFELLHTHARVLTFGVAYSFY